MLQDGFFKKACSTMGNNRFLRVEGTSGKTRSTIEIKVFFMQITCLPDRGFAAQLFPTCATFRRLTGVGGSGVDEKKG